MTAVPVPADGHDAVASCPVFIVGTFTVRPGTACTGTGWPADAAGVAADAGAAGSVTATMSALTNETATAQATITCRRCRARRQCRRTHRSARTIAAGPTVFRRGARDLIISTDPHRAAAFAGLRSGPTKRCHSAAPTCHKP
jgi:hypothetical protein